MIVEERENVVAAVDIRILARRRREEEEEEEQQMQPKRESTFSPSELV